MFDRLIFTTLFLLFTFSGISKESSSWEGDTHQADSLYQTIRGIVVDEDSHHPIIGATVTIVGSDPLRGTITNQFGSFRIEKVPVGRIDLQFDFLGYESIVLSNQRVEAGKELVLEIGMAELLTKLDEVIVSPVLDKSRPLNEMSTVSAKSFTVEETSRYAGSFNDPARMASSYAGVSGSQDDAENAIIIRGNSPRGVLWRLEGVEIPNPNHFASEGASSGAISMLNSNVLTNSDFITGAFAPEYGNAMSGVFDLKLRNGNNEQREFSVQGGLLGMDVSLEGPLALFKDAEVPNTSYLFNYRYSTVALLESLGIIGSDDGSPAPRFQDVSFKFSIPTTSLGTISLWGLGGISSSKDPNEVFEAGQLFSTADDEDYKLGIIGVSNTLQLDGSSFLESGISMTQTKYVALNEGVFQEQIFEEDREEYLNTTKRLYSTLTKKLNARHTTKLGITYSHLAYKLKSEGFFTDRSPRYSLSERGSTSMLQSYISHKFKLTDDLIMIGGLHYIRLNLAGQYNIEPRVGVSWNFAPNQTLSFGFGVHSKREEMSLYLTELPSTNGSTYRPNRELELSKSRHFVIGYDRIFKRNIHLKVEAYYQDLYDIPIENLPFSSFSTLNLDDAFVRIPLVNGGVGRNQGVEITLEKFLTRGFYFLTTGSIYDSKYKAANGKELNTRYNGNYQYNLVAGKEFNLKNSSKKKKILRIGIERILAGGRRLIPIDFDASLNAGGTVLDYDNAYSRQLDAYSRTDFQIAIRTNKKRTTHEWKLDLQNVGGDLYPAEEAFSASERAIVITDFQGDLIPIMSYKVTF